VALTGTRLDRLRTWLDSVAAAGRHVVVITGSRRPWEPLPDGVTVIELVPLEARTWWARWFLVDRAEAFRYVDRARAKVLHGLARRPWPGRVRGAAAWRAAQARERVSRGRRGRWREWTASEPARHIRPWLLWRSLRRYALDQVPVDRIDLIVWADEQSWPIVWQLARRARGAEIKGFFDVA
jgi:hypothetical protein